MPVKYYAGGGIYRATLPTLSDGDPTDLHVDQSGRAHLADANATSATVLSQSAQGTGAQNGADQTNTYWRGGVFYLNVSSIDSGSPTLDVKLQGKDGASGNYVDIAGAAFAQQSSTTTVALTVYPGVAETANVSVSDVIPYTWRAVGTVAGTSTPTVSYTVSAFMLR